MGVKLKNKKKYKFPLVCLESWVRTIKNKKESIDVCQKNPQVYVFSSVLWVNYYIILIITQIW